MFPASSPTVSAVFTPLIARTSLPLRPSTLLSTISLLVTAITLTLLTTGSETTSTIPGLLGGWGGSTLTTEVIHTATTDSALVSTIPMEVWATFLLQLLLPQWMKNSRDVIR